MSDAPVFHLDPDDFWKDPYPSLQQMRAEAPICTVPELGATLLTKRDDIHTCEKNIDVFSSDQPGGLMNLLMGKNMMRSDGEDHRRERFVYYPVISPRRVKTGWAQRFDRIADTVLDDISSTMENGIDLVTTFATAMSGECLKAMTGLTNITYQQMDSWSQAMIDGIANYGGDPDIETACRTATAAIDAAIDERLIDLRARPDDSLLSALTRSDMPEANVRANIKLTISGGQNEPRDAIAGSVWALLTHPDQLALVRSGTVSWLDAFEEYCRWISPIGMSPRRIAADHTYGGVRFETDDRVFLMFSSANHDETHFDEPERFDVGRDTTAALTFGAGPHFCAGAAAARSMVGDSALPRLFERFPDLALDPDADPARFGGWAFRGPLNLGVRTSGSTRPVPSAT